MDYDKAKQILADIAPELAVGADTGLPHIDVYLKNEAGDATGAPFSISLPRTTPGNPMKPEDEHLSFIQSVQAAKRHFT